MAAFLNVLGLALDLAIVIFAFTLIIVIHELGHFVAARWAGIRVLAFAVGFGPALVSYRKGLGWRRGSSAAEYNALARHIDTKVDRGWLHLPERINRPVSPTEYRLNSLPFGGYVKMLGQDDADPTATSSEPDGYQRTSPWKRMVVISAGVVFNLISAGALFIIVFMAGLKTEPPVIGIVEPGSPAATAVALEAADLAVTTPGLMAGDRVLFIDGDPAQSFKDLMLASAMARRGDPIALTVEREGVPRPLTFRVVPKESPVTKLLQFGVGPAVSTRVLSSHRASETAEIKAALQRLGFTGVEPGMRLTRVNGAEVPITGGGGGSGAIADAARRSDGRPLTLEFVSDSPPGAPVAVTLQPTPKLDQLALQVTADSAAVLAHVAGLAPAMQVDSVSTEAAKAAGLKAGDVFAQIGAVEWPSQPAGIAEIRRHRGSVVHVAVARQDAGGNDARWTIVDLKLVPVNKEGQVGFNVAPPDKSPLFLGAWTDLPNAKNIDGETTDTPRPDTLAKLRITPGSLLTRVAGTPVRTLRDLRVALAKAVPDRSAAGAEGPAPEPSPATALTPTVELTIIPPLTDASGSLSAPPQTVTWTPDGAALQPVMWQSEAAGYLFEPQQFELKASTPLDAMRMGFRETRQVVLSTYVTLLRLFQGSVKIEHLKGPVGIAHMGTMLVDRGLVWMLFFSAIVSVNLAVINFLPIPITDGGHMLFLLYEQLTGRPASIAVQNATMIVGLTILAGLFLIVTFNDITNLVGGR